MFRFQRSRSRRVNKAIAAPVEAEVLDARQMLSGNVVVTIDDGALRIVGDAEDNRLSVRVADLRWDSYPFPFMTNRYWHDGPPEYRELVFESDAGTTVNGQPAEEMRIRFNANRRWGDSIRGIDVRLGQGDDALTLDLTPVPDFDPEDYYASYGRPDQLQLRFQSIVNPVTGFVGRFDFPEAYDNITSYVELGVAVRLGSGNDSFAMSGVQTDGRITVLGQGGDDSIAVRDVYADGLVIRTARGADRISVEGWIDGTTVINSGRGDDYIEVGADTATKMLNIKTESGDDRISADGEYHSLVMRTGSGHDHVEFFGSVAQEDSRTLLDLGSGDDHLALATEPDYSFTQVDKAAPGIGDFIEFGCLGVTRGTAVLTGEIRILGRGGNDEIVLTHEVTRQLSSFHRSVLLRADRVTINGGAGRDSISASAAMFRDLANYRVRRVEEQHEVYVPPLGGALPHPTL